MKLLLVFMLILLVVILFALFGPSSPRPAPAAAPAQPAVATQTRTAPPTGTAKPVPAAPSPRQQGGLSTPALATGVTTETVDLGGESATYQAKRRMSDKLSKLSPSAQK